MVIDTKRGPRVITGDCMYAAYQVTGRGGDGVYVPLTNALGTTLDQLKTLDRVHQAIDGDLSRLVLLHDPKGWPDLPVVQEVDGFRIRQAA